MTPARFVPQLQSLCWIASCELLWYWTVPHLLFLFSCFLSPVSDSLPWSRSLFSVMSLCETRNRTTSLFSFFMGTMSSRHQNLEPVQREKRFQPKNKLAWNPQTLFWLTQSNVTVSSSCSVLPLFLYRMISVLNSLRSSRAFCICEVRRPLVSLPYRKWHMQLFCISSPRPKPVSSQKPSEQ